MKLRTSPLHLGAEWNSDSLRQFQLSQLTHQVSRGIPIDRCAAPTPTSFFPRPCTPTSPALSVHARGSCTDSLHVELPLVFRTDNICFSAFVTASELLAYEPTGAACPSLCWPDTASCCLSVSFVGHPPGFIPRAYKLRQLMGFFTLATIT